VQSLRAVRRGKFIGHARFKVGRLFEGKAGSASVVGRKRFFFFFFWAGSPAGM